METNKALETAAAILKEKGPGPGMAPALLEQIIGPELCKLPTGREAYEWQECNDVPVPPPIGLLVHWHRLSHTKIQELTETVAEKDACIKGLKEDLKLLMDAQQDLVAQQLQPFDKKRKTEPDGSPYVPLDFIDSQGRHIQEITYPTTDE